MTDISSRVAGLSPSGIRDVFKAAGDDTINLGLGQPDFPTPDHVRRAAIDAIESGQVDAYTANKGIPELRDAISAKYRQDFGLDVSTNRVIATAGASQALHLALVAHVNPGQEVLIPDPGFVSYGALTRLAGGVPQPIPLRSDLTLDPERVEEAIDEDTAAFIINSPANPTGAVQSEADIREFARIADEHDVLCISDEVYERIIFDGNHYSPLEFAGDENVIVVSSCSKTYSMTGWRLGWIIASESRIQQMVQVHQFSQACASAPAQYAAEAALTGPQDCINEMVEAFEYRRDVVVDGLEDANLPVPTPEGAFYVMPRVPDGWCEEVIERGVIVVPGQAFGDYGERYARLSYSTSISDLKDALGIIRKATLSVR